MAAAERLTQSHAPRVNWRDSLLVLLLPLLLGAAIYTALDQASVARLNNAHAETLRQAQAVLAADFAGLQRNLRLLGEELNAIESTETASAHQLIAAAFSRHMRANPYLMQLRVIDNSGMEQVRVDQVGGGGRVVPDEELQNKASRYYVRDALKTPAPAIYFSPIDLNVEHDEIERPFKPTIRLALGIDSQPFGSAALIVMNVNVGSMLEQLRLISADETRLIVADSEGYFLLHPDPLNEWGRDLGNDTLRLGSMAPDLWDRLCEGAIRFPMDSAIGPASSDRLKVEDAGAPELHLIAATAPGPYSIERRRIILIPALVALTLAAIAGTLRYRERVQAILREELLNALERERNELRESLERERALQLQLVEERKLASLGMMVAGVAHELNTPIGTAMLVNARNRDHSRQMVDKISSGLTRQALEEYVKDAGENATMIERSLNRCAELIKSFKRLASDRASASLSDFALDQVIDDLAVSLRPRLKHSPFKLVIDCPKGIMMHSDPGALSQALQNLVDNALLHGLGGASSGQISITASAMDDRVEIRVSDNGKGIPDELQTTVFDPFVTTARNAGGTGLGLHLVAQLVSGTLGGHIRLADSSPQGTTFELNVPRRIRTSEAIDERAQG